MRPSGTYLSEPSIGLTTHYVHASVRCNPPTRGGGSGRLRNRGGAGTVVQPMRGSLSLSSWIVVLALGSGCDAKPDKPEPAKAPASAPTADAKPTVEAVEPEQPVAHEENAGSPGVREDGSIVSAVQWFEGSLEQAKEKARAEKKLLFVEVGAYWCPPCHKLDEEVFIKDAVAEALAAGYVAVHVDAEKGDGPEIVEAHHVQAYPTMLVLEASGIEKGRIVDFIEPDALLAALKRIEQGQSVLADVEAQVEAKPDDVALRQRLGHLYVLAGHKEAAVAEFERVLEADPRNELGLASKVLYDQALFITHKLDGDLDRAIADFRTLQKRYPDSKEAARAYRQIGRILNKQGKPKKAIAELDAMLALDPEDVGLASSYGWFSFRQKCEPAKALAVVRAAIEKNPKEAELFYLSAELSHQLGKTAAARLAINVAMKLEPKSAFYRRQVRRLQEGA